MLMSVVSYFLGWIFPPKCLICSELLHMHSSVKYVCEKCNENLPFIVLPVCSNCGKHIDNEIHDKCQICMDSKFSFSKGFAAFDYDIMKSPIAHFKFKGFKNDGIGLAWLMYEFIEINHKEFIKSVDMLVPVPMYSKKQNKRGFNQSEILSNELGRLLQIPSYSNIIIRVKSTIPQNSLSPKERKHNISKAFSIENKEKIIGKRIMIIDDIFTTGSTIDECSKALYNAGAGYVCFYTLSIV